MRHRRARLEHQRHGDFDTIHSYLDGEGYRLVGVLFRQKFKMFSTKKIPNTSQTAKSEPEVSETVEMGSRWPDLDTRTLTWLPAGQDFGEERFVQNDGRDLCCRSEIRRFQIRRAWPAKFEPETD